MLKSAHTTSEFAANVHGLFVFAHLPFYYLLVYALARHFIGS